MIIYVPSKVTTWRVPPFFINHGLLIRLTLHHQLNQAPHVQLPPHPRDPAAPSHCWTPSRSHGSKFGAPTIWEWRIKNA